MSVTPRDRIQFGRSVHSRFAAGHRFHRVILTVCVVQQMLAGLYAFFCFSCFMSKLATRLDECYCGPSCCDRLFTIPMRTKVRAMYGIKVGSAVPYLRARCRCSFGL